MKTIIKENISVEDSLALAECALKVAEENGFNVSATVVDSSGITVAVARNNQANPMTISSSFKKAYTAAVTHNRTQMFADHADKDPMVLELTNACDDCFVYGGGVPIFNDKTLVGAIGIAGCPGGNNDDKVATEAISRMNF